MESIIKDYSSHTAAAESLPVIEITLKKYKCKQQKDTKIPKEAMRARNKFLKNCKLWNCWKFIGRIKWRKNDNWAGHKSQSWAIEVFLNFFNNKKLLFLSS